MNDSTPQPPQHSPQQQPLAVPGDSSPVNPYGMNPYAQQQSPKKRSWLPIIVGVLAVMVVGLLVVVWTLLPGTGSTPTQVTGSTPAQVTGSTPAQVAGDPPVVVTNDTIRVGAADAPVLVSTYFDYMCPHCARSEAANGADLIEMVRAGQIRLDLHVMSFLDISSTTRYSTRAANAVVTVANESPAQLLDFYSALFALQPAQGGAGFDDAQMVALADELGIPSSVSEKFQLLADASWTQAATQGAAATGVNSTPQAFVNGQAVDPYTLGGIKAAVQALK